MQVFFCEQCGARTNDVELEKGHGVRLGDDVWCMRCVKHAPAEASASNGDDSAAGSTPERKRAGRRSRSGKHAPTPDPAKAAQQKNAMIAVGVGLAALAGMWFLLTGSPSDLSHDAPSPPAPKKTTKKKKPSATPKAGPNQAVKPKPVPSKKTALQDISVTVVSPTPNATHVVGSDLSFALILYGQVDRVEYSKGETMLGVAKVPPYGFTWRDCPLGLHTIKVTAYDHAGRHAEPVYVKVLIDKSLFSKNVQVLWEEKWYDAKVLKEEKGRWYVHYLEDDDTWDEWVTKERIRIKPEGK
jgi:hypothetical protein